jgi:hypothetical protein
MSFRDKLFDGRIRFFAGNFLRVSNRENLPALSSFGSNVRQHRHKAMRLCAILRASLTPRRVRKAWAVVRLAFEDGLEADFADVRDMPNSGLGIVLGTGTI